MTGKKIPEKPPSKRGGGKLKKSAKAISDAAQPPADERTDESPASPVAGPVGVSIPAEILTRMQAAAPPPKPIYISFSAEINANTTESLIALIAQQVNAGAQEIYLMISTPGGTVMNGLNLYNVLRAFPVHLTTHNVGNIDSIGNAIFLAGKTRYACPHSTFMFHGVGVNSGTAARFEQKNLQEMIGSILADQKRIGDLIQEHTTLKAGQVRGLFKEARTKDANYARSVGIIHEIRDVNIPPGVPVFGLVFQR